MSDVVIEYGGVRNARPRGGWLPTIWVDGERVGEAYSGESGSSTEEEAATTAEARARALAASSPYWGKWVTVRRRVSP